MSLPAEDFAELGQQEVGVVTEAEVGEMDAVDSAVVLGAVKTFGFDEVEVGIAFVLKPLIVAAVSVVFGRQVFVEHRIVAVVGIERAGKHHDRRIGVCVGEDLHEVVGERVALHLGAVGHRVEQEQVDIGNLVHGAGHALVLLALARDADVDYLGVELAADDVGAAHAGARGAAALQDARAVGHYLAFGRDDLRIARGDDSIAVDLDPQLVYAVV